MEKPLTIALIYDFDGTLSPCNMQEYEFIPAIGLENEDFWNESNQIAEDQDADPVLAYLWLMVKASRSAGRSLRKESFRQSGATIELFKGVKEWFSRINKYAADKGITIEHYINSSGIKEMIEGTPIASEFKKIYACSFLYDVDGVAYWPAVSVNYTNKTQFMFKINKGIDGVFENVKINEFIPEDERPIPFKHMIYFGDGTTDIPCMRLVKEKGGHSIAVYNPKNITNSSIEKLITDNRVNFVSPADYSEESRLDTIVKCIIDKIKADHKLTSLY